MSLPIKIHLVAGARPNLMKVAPLFHALKKESWCDVEIVATGQHYSPELSEVFLKEFSLPSPDHQLEVGEGSSDEQLSKIVSKYQTILERTQPHLVIVVGDVTSTLAGCLAAKSKNILVSHVEAGLRSWDLSMPEERNRIAVDKVADLLFAPSRDGVENLINEGRSPDCIFMVGNIMIDTYCLVKSRIDEFSQKNPNPFGSKKFALVTLHRPSNVDEKLRLKLVVESLMEAGEVVPLLFPVHPRTKKRLKEFHLWEKLSSRPEKIKLIPPLGYIEFMSYLGKGLCAITDSGGIQEETTYLNIACLTLRKNTERPVTMSQGTNRLIEPENLVEALQSCLLHPVVKSEPPELWDGRTAERISSILKNYFEAR